MGSKEIQRNSHLSYILSKTMSLQYRKKLVSNSATSTTTLITNIQKFNLLYLPQVRANIDHK